MAVAVITRAVAICICLSLCRLSSVDAEDRNRVDRLVNLAGWTFPGQYVIAGRKPSSTTVVRIDGVPTQLSRFSDLPVWNKRQRHYLATKVIFAFTAGPSIAIIDERQLVTNELSRYSVGNRPFLYTMAAYPCSVDPKNRFGGCSGADVTLAYYDEDGDGRLETMEIVNPIISSDTSLNWHPRIPSWAAALVLPRD